MNTGIHSDGNTKSIVAALRKAGASVHYWNGFSRQAGQPDLICGFKGTTFLVEVKAAKGKLSAVQEEWHARWPGGPIVIVRDEQSALAAIGACP